MSAEFPPVFIGGSRRCGTTLLSDLLGQHPEVSPIYETDFVLALLEAFVDVEGLPLEEKLAQFREFAFEWSETLPHRPDRELSTQKGDYETYSHGPNYFLLTTEEFRQYTEEFIERMKDTNDHQTIADYLRKLFAEHCRKDDKPCWLNKTPRYAQYPEILLDWIPEMKFIHALRDPRAVVASMLRFGWAPDTVRECALRWTDFVYSAVQFGENHPEHYLEVKYESLLKMPERCLRMALRQLSGQSPSGELVEAMLSKVPELEPDRLDKWKNQLSTEDLRIIHDKTAPVLRLTGYQFSVD